MSEELFIELCDAVRKKDEKRILELLEAHAPFRLLNGEETVIGIALRLEYWEGIQLFIERSREREEVKFIVDKIIDFELLSSFSTYIDRLDETVKSMIKAKLCFALGQMLFKAVTDNHPFLLRLLLKLDADRSVTTPEFQENRVNPLSAPISFTPHLITPIELAYHKQAWELISIFTDYSVTVETSVVTGYSKVLYELAESGDPEHIDFMRLLVRAGTNYSVPDPGSKRSAFYWAIKHRMTPLICDMFQCNPNVLLENHGLMFLDENIRALYQAIPEGWSGIVKTLISLDHTRGNIEKCFETVFELLQNQIQDLNDQIFKSMIGKALALPHLALPFITLLNKLGLVLIPMERGEKPPLQRVVEHCIQSTQLEEDKPPLISDHFQVVPSEKTTVSQAGYGVSILMLAEKNSFDLIIPLINGLDKAHFNHPQTITCLIKTVELMLSKEVSLSTMFTILSAYRDVDPELEKVQASLRVFLNSSKHQEKWISLLLWLIKSEIPIIKIRAIISHLVALELAEALFESSHIKEGSDLVRRSVSISGTNYEAELKDALTKQCLHAAKAMIECRKNKDANTTHLLMLINKIILFKGKPNPSLSDIIHFSLTECNYVYPETLCVDIGVRLNYLYSRWRSRCEDGSLSFNNSEREAFLAIVHMQSSSTVSKQHLLLTSFLCNHPVVIASKNEAISSSYKEILCFEPEYQGFTDFFSSAPSTKGFALAISAIKKYVSQRDIMLEPAQQDASTFALLSLKYALSQYPVKEDKNIRAQFMVVIKHWQKSPSIKPGATNAQVLSTSAEEGIFNKLWAAMSTATPLHDKAFVDSLADTVYPDPTCTSSSSAKSRSWTTCSLT